jgi:hypothetical protein
MGHSLMSRQWRRQALSRAEQVHTEQLRREL